MSESTHSSSSIAPSGTSVKSELSNKLKGLPVDNRERDASLHVGITSEDVEAVMDRYQSHRQSVDVECRIKMGDMWRQLHGPEFKDVRMAWLRSKQSKMTDEQYARYIRFYKDAGWVAGVWPIHERTFKHSWTYMRENAPGLTKKPALPEMPLDLDFQGMVFGEDWTIMKFRLPNGKPCNYRVAVPPEE